MIKNESYINIQGWMINELGLKGNDLIVYAAIYGFSQDGESQFRGSLQYLADWCNSTKQGVMKNIKNLLEMGVIQKEEIFINKVKFCNYKADRTSNNEQCKPKDDTKKDGYATKFNGGIQQSLPPMQQSLIHNLEDNIDNDNIDTKKELKNITWSDSEESPGTDFDEEILEREINKACEDNSILDDGGSREDIAKIIVCYYRKYISCFGREHPRINQRAMDGVVKRLYAGTFAVDGMDFEMYRDMIDKHFETRYVNCDYSICHFMTEGIRNFRAVETGNVGGSSLIY